MIHVVTVHWKSPKWIELQNKYLRNNIDDEFIIYAFLNKIPQKYYKFFDYAYNEDIEAHSIKLNILGNYAVFNSNSPDDILIFIDGDAFPITNIDNFIKEKLKKYNLIAVQRKENNGDIQPHPCFCATTIGYWEKIHGDWRDGYKWKAGNGEMVTDVGGNLLGILESNNAKWYKMRRSNKKNIHKIWFGLYDNKIYHHGAGFRVLISRNDLKIFRLIFNKIMPNYFQKIIKTSKFTRFILAKFGESNELRRLEKKIFDEMKKNTQFYKNI